MKRLKEMVVILFFALLTAGFTSSAMASSGNDDPWNFDLDFSGSHYYCKLIQAGELQLPPPLGEYCWH
ncbi:hypothetical protein FPE49_003192 [Salmonella bongori]|uniref:hypothetical protein n=1 Tax=Salmonella bongori TaxID=54736 RepID=UPI0009AA6412|nr:hypothetical protein [Salmonella bongori]ECG1191747.1 hypothetical protein [Salmonella bongori]EDP8624938.1 hypothetical protein [Salmonella bongori]EDP8643874.1 hypothetical protein [Salmonella bongori]HAB1658534.1 hypothetical protein [Salmonella bongori]